jgi:carbonic anhydrase
LKNISPAIDEVKGDHGERNSKNAAFVHRVAEQNVRRTLRRIREESPVLRDLEKDGKIKIVGGMYDMDTGVVEAIE